ncbi:hypothetical protein GSI_00087 [Ganoderma sinense ZZ0214-1]|uniref:Lipocalin-like domain-containing protein n=1 Tax=Ganoderma sinense ZZ0214-1 TaxID=1077348 RepID=A0A2G8SRK5_9APHY|nr:hypothetical protein GSI_00087 [Ganoderma sinense ZZ0214-1]
MRFSSLFSSLTAVLAASTAAVLAQSPLPTPKFEALFAGQFTISSSPNTTGPFGTRVHFVISGGTLADATTGKTVATILPFADDGIVSDSGLFFPDSFLPITWSVDGHLASIKVTGIGNLNNGSMSYAHVETDSPTYSWMNSNFFITKLSATNPTQPTFTIYGVANATTKY